MLQPHDSRPGRTAGPIDRPQNTNLSVETCSPDPQIEDYLDHVCAPLVGLVPYARRQELRAELRGHLEALVATHEELGSARTAAVVLALRQFGPPRCLSRQWAREWTHGAAPAGPQPAWPAMFVALGSFGLASLLALVMLAPLTVGIGSYRNDGSVPVVALISILLPLLAGLTTGLLSPVRHALGTFYALAVLMLPSTALAISSLPQPQDSTGLAATSVLLALVQPIFWVPIGCGAAALGGSLRARLALRPRHWVLQ